MRLRNNARSCGLEWLLAICVVTACSKRHEPVRDPAASSQMAAGGAPSSANPSPGAGHAAGQSGAVATSVHTLPAAHEERGQPAANGVSDESASEVWVGVLRNPYGASVNSRAYVSDDLAAALVLRRDRERKIASGSIAFGDPNTAPTLAALANIPQPVLEGDDVPFWDAARDGVVTGFEYELLNPILSTDTQLQFMLSGAQLWRTWCCKADGTYACPPEVVRPFDTSLSGDTKSGCTELPITLTFDLRVDGDVMEGVLAPGVRWANTVLKVRRQR